MQDGKAFPDDKVKQTTIVFKGDTFRFPELADYATSKEGTIKLDATTEPEAHGRYLDQGRGHAGHLRTGRRPV